MKTQIQDRHMGRAGRTVAAQRRQYLSRQRTGSIGSKGSELRKETNKAKTRSEVKTDTEQSETNFWGDLFRAWGEVLALRWEQAEWVGRMVKVGEMEQEVNLGWEGGEGGGNVRKGEVRLCAWYLKGAPGCFSPWWGSSWCYQSSLQYLPLGCKFWGKWLNRDLTSRWWSKYYFKS